jgi:hypothetical protein
MEENNGKERGFLWEKRPRRFAGGMSAKNFAGNRACSV